MAGTIIADKIQTENSFLQLNVGQTQIATMNASGIFSSSGAKMLGTDGSIGNSTISGATVSGNLSFDSTGTSGIRLPAANTLAFHTTGAEDMRIDATGNVGIGTSSPTGKLDVSSSSAGVTAGDLVVDTANKTVYVGRQSSTGGDNSYLIVRGRVNGNTANQAVAITGDTTAYGTGLFRPNNDMLGFSTLSTERMRITSSGDLLVGQTTRSTATVGFSIISSGGDAGQTNITTNGTEVVNINRNTSDGELIRFRQDNTVEGTISVSGTTVSYNGGHLSRYAQIANGNTNIILKGTVLSNLDEMNVYIDADGNSVTNEQLNKVKISNIEADANVAGVFVNWAYDEAHDIEEINMAMTGDMIIRIAEGVTVARGDLLMSAGDGTAKPQSDDIVRSKTIAKVTSTHVTCTYEDGSYCVPCVLMAC